MGQKKKENTTTADTAAAPAAPAAPATPADMVFAELHQLFLQQRQQQCPQREEWYQLQHQPGLEQRDQKLLYLQKNEVKQRQQQRRL